jgi:hypothetical protein
VISLALVLAQAAINLSLSQAKELSPAAAGDAILHDKQHGPIETFETTTDGMLPPGMAKGELAERPTTAGSACVRMVWTVQFRAAPGADISTAKAKSTYSTQEITLSPTGTCPPGRYVHLNLGVDIEHGRKALVRLKEVSAVKSRARFKCLDETSSGLCNSNAAILTALQTLKPWAITQSDEDILIWLGVRGSVLTEVRLKSDQRSQVVVTRKMPPPF